MTHKMGNLKVIAQQIVTASRSFLKSPSPNVHMFRCLTRACHFQPHNCCSPARSPQKEHDLLELSAFHVYICASAHAVLWWSMRNQAEFSCSWASVRSYLRWHAIHPAKNKHTHSLALLKCHFKQPPANSVCKHNLVGNNGGVVCLKEMFLLQISIVEMKPFCCSFPSWVMLWSDPISSLWSSPGTSKTCHRHTPQP